MILSFGNKKLILNLTKDFLLHTAQVPPTKKFFQNKSGMKAKARERSVSYKAKQSENKKTEV